MVVILVLLLIAAMAGVLGTVLKAALVIVLAVILAFLILVFGTFWYVRHRVNRFLRHAERQQRGYPTRGYKGSLPPD